MTELAVVTGANSGIGLATALSLAHAGYRVFAGARRVEGLEAIAQAASDAGLSDTAGQAGIVAVMIDVTDDGTGIAADVLPQVFEPHFSTRTSGSGLGLAISRRLIEGWGGTIGLTSTPGAGTTVRLMLRRAPSP